MPAPFLLAWPQPLVSAAAAAAVSRSHRQTRRIPVAVEAELHRPVGVAVPLVEAYPRLRETIGPSDNYGVEESSAERISAAGHIAVFWGAPDEDLR